MLQRKTRVRHQQELEFAASHRRRPGNALLVAPCECGSGDDRHRDPPAPDGSENGNIHSRRPWKSSNVAQVKNFIAKSIYCRFIYGRFSIPVGIYVPAGLVPRWNRVSLKGLDEPAATGADGSPL